MEQLTWNVASSQFFKVVLTGCACVVEERQLTAACGRKTDTYLRERGFEVFTAPEAFTILASNGLSLDYFATDGIENILKARGLKMEQLTWNVASSQFFKVVLTGCACVVEERQLTAACGRKTDTYLRERGFEVFTAPEAFTILASNGLSLDYFATDGIENILKARGLKMEQLTWNVASSQFFKVVLTGCACVVEERRLTAACGRKTDTYLRERGFEVFTAPEAFTILASNGLSLDYFATDGIENILKARGLKRWSSLHGTSPRSQFFKVVLTGCACVVEERQLTAACGRKTDTYFTRTWF